MCLLSVLLEGNSFAYAGIKFSDSFSFGIYRALAFAYIRQVFMFLLFLFFDFFLFPIVFLEYCTMGALYISSMGGEVNRKNRTG